MFSVKITFILFKCHRSIDNSNDFSFYLVMKRIMISKNSVVKIQNLVVNHNSRTLKSNPGSHFSRFVLGLCFLASTKKTIQWSYNTLKIPWDLFYQICSREMLLGCITTGIGSWLTSNHMASCAVNNKFDLW